MASFDYPFGVRVKFNNKIEMIELEWNHISSESFMKEGELLLHITEFMYKILSITHIRVVHCFFYSCGSFRYKNRPRTRSSSQIN